MQHYHLISSGPVSSPVYQLFPPFRSRVSLLSPPDFLFFLSRPFFHPYLLLLSFSSSSPSLIQIRFFTENLVSSFVSISFLLFLLLFHFFHSSPSSLSSFHPPSSSYFHVDATPIEPPISYPRSSSRRPFNPISSGGG